MKQTLTLLNHTYSKDGTVTIGNKTYKLKQSALSAELSNVFKQDKNDIKRTIDTRLDGKM